MPPNLLIRRHFLSRIRARGQGLGGAARKLLSTPHVHRLAVLDRSRRHVHRRGRARARRRNHHPQAAVRKPRALRGCGARGHPPDPRHRAGRADPGRRDRGRQDGHDRRHQRVARTQRRTHGAGDQSRLRRRAAHRLSEPAAHLRPPHRVARAFVRARDRGARPLHRRGRGDREARSQTRRARASSGPSATASDRSRSC